MKKKATRLLITSPFLKSGGVYMVVKNILPYFSHEVMIFYRGKKENHKRKFQIIFNSLFTLFRFIYYLSKFKFDYIIINTSLSKNCIVRDGFLVAISKLFRKKVILIIHGFDEKTLQYKFLLKQGYFRADSLVVNASNFKNILRSAGFKREIFTQFNPVSIDLLYDFKNKQKKENYTSPIMNILFLARIEKNKGVYKCIDAFKIISNKMPKVTLTIAGIGSELNNIRKYIKQNAIDNVVVISKFPSGKGKRDILNQSDILLFPTTHKEGLPINVLEAMVAGMIIITRPVAGLVDLFEQQPFGKLIDSTNPDDFASAVIECIESSETANIRVTNAKFAQEHFHPEMIVKNIEVIAESTLKN